VNSPLREVMLNNQNQNTSVKAPEVRSFNPMVSPQLMMRQATKINENIILFDLSALTYKSISFL
jgi:hypothetical protein